MVAGDHHRDDAGRPTGGDCLARFLARRVHDADEAEEGEVALDRLGTDGGGQDRPPAQAHGEHPEPVGRHALADLDQLVAPDLPRAGRGEDLGGALEDRLDRALREGDEAARRVAMKRRHALALGVEGKLGGPRKLRLLFGLLDAGVEKPKEEPQFARAAELPFDSERKCMTTLHRHPAGGFISFTKGAVEAVLERSTEVLTSAGPREVRRHELIEVSERMAADGLRVLAVGLRRWAVLPASVSSESVERDLTLLGFVGIMDPPREEAREAVATCRAAGIVPVMITGDHALTARAIARRLGILDDDGAAVMTGPELAALPSRPSRSACARSACTPGSRQSRSSKSSRPSRTRESSSP